MESLKKEHRIMLRFRNHPRIVQTTNPNLHIGINLDHCYITTRKQGDSDGRNRQKFVGIDQFRRISDEPIFRYRFVGKKKFFGISSDLLMTFWRIPRNVNLTNFRRYYDTDTRDQSSSEKLYTDGERSSDYTDERSPRKIPTDYGA